MKVTLKVGEVSLTVDGLDLDRKEIRRLLMDCAGIAAAMAEEPESGPPMGFTVLTELSKPDEPDLSEYFEDEE